MIAHLHHAAWKTWVAKLSTILAALLAVVPAAAPRELSAWFADQFPILPTWAHWAAAGAIVAARLGVAVWRIARTEERAA